MQFACFNVKRIRVYDEQTNQHFSTDIAYGNFLLEHQVRTEQIHMTIKELGYRL